MKASTLIVLIAVAGGALQNRAKISHWLNPPPPVSHASMNSEVVLYSTSWCGYCAKTRAYFAENHIKYIDLDIENSEKGRADYERFGGNGVPMVLINDETLIHGYDPEKISEVLNSAESP